jgi:hypothetical protein
MIEIIDTAIAELEENKKMILERQENGKIIQPLIIDIDSSRNFIAIPK